MGFIFEQMNGLTTSVNICGHRDDLCCFESEAMYGVLIYLCMHPELFWRESVFIWTRPIFFLAALGLRDSITPDRSAKHIG